MGICATVQSASGVSLVENCVGGHAYPRRLRSDWPKTPRRSKFFLGQRHSSRGGAIVPLTTGDNVCPVQTCLPRGPVVSSAMFSFRLLFSPF